jgi:hypothetical protein
MVKVVAPGASAFVSSSIVASSMVDRHNDRRALSNDEKWQRDPRHKYQTIQNVQSKDETGQLGEKKVPEP